MGTYPLLWCCGRSFTIHVFVVTRNCFQLTWHWIARVEFGRYILLWCCSRNFAVSIVLRIVFIWHDIVLTETILPLRCKQNICFKYRSHNFKPLSLPYYLYILLHVIDVLISCRSCVKLCVFRAGDTHKTQSEPIHVVSLIYSIPPTLYRGSGGSCLCGARCMAGPHDTDIDLFTACVLFYEEIVRQIFLNSELLNSILFFFVCGLCFIWWALFPRKMWQVLSVTGQYWLFFKGNILWISTSFVVLPNKALHCHKFSEVTLSCLT